MAAIDVVALVAPSAGQRGTRPPKLLMADPHSPSSFLSDFLVYL